MNSEQETGNIRGLLASAIYFDELHRSHRPAAKVKRVRPKSKKTLETRAKNKQSRKSRKKNRK